MPVRFVKIAPRDVDPHRVTLTVFAGPADAGVLGRISTLAFGEDGVEVMTTEGADPPIADALTLAVDLATFKDEDVDVVDEAGLWQDLWGRLEGG